MNKRAAIPGRSRAELRDLDLESKKCFVCGEKCTKIVKISNKPVTDTVLEFNRCDWHSEELVYAITAADGVVLQVEVLKR